MVCSFKTPEEWRQKGRLEQAIANLEVIKNANAFVVCDQVVLGNENLEAYQKYARISLAASKGLLVLLKKQVEGR